jgi:hypothetical protein
MTERKLTPVMLYRPVGQAELDLIRDLGMRAFPPRLPEQPIFYPVTNQRYAEQIARDWNTRDERSDYTGYVLSFAVDAEYLSQFPTRTVGKKEHTEYWIPAERLQEFNQHIIGKIQILAVYRKYDRG